VNGAVGRIILVASGLGYPLTQVAIARLRRPGAIVVQTLTIALLVRDAALVATGTTGSLERGPAALLVAETAAASVAAIANTSLGTAAGRAAATTRGWHVGKRELVRRAAVGALFGIHTIRFRIYLAPGSGLRAT
jgi:glycerate kinase